jgi:hypothetical protein
MAQGEAEVADGSAMGEAYSPPAEGKPAADSYSGAAQQPRSAKTHGHGGGTRDGPAPRTPPISSRWQPLSVALSQRTCQPPDKSRVARTQTSLYLMKIALPIPGRRGRDSAFIPCEMMCHAPTNLVFLPHLTLESKLCLSTRRRFDAYRSGNTIKP